MVERFELPYPPADETRYIHLYLPEGYHDSQERYPVLYMFDGHNMFFDSDATYGTCWGLKDFLDHWDKPLIVVGLECSHTGDSRLSEYSPYNFRTRKMGAVKGLGDLTMQWIVDIVKPYIDKNYRTWPHREATAIGGSSMGGLMALYAVLRYNRWFSKAACVSPTVSIAMAKLRNEAAKADLDNDTRIFFSWGSKEWRGSDRPTTRNITQLEAIALSKGARTWLYHQIGGHHCEAHWALQVSTWMEFLWKNP
ncbi:MAG: alpha/beta hydrolase [Muribaculaceae bacterium]